MNPEHFEEEAELRELLKCAQFHRRYSDDPRGKYAPGSSVGAALCTRERWKFFGANRIPAAFRGKVAPLEGPDDPRRYHVIEHAERLVLFEALLGGHNIFGATLACTRFPCSDCARVITIFGIGKLVVPIDAKDEAGKWKDAQAEAERILQAADVEIIYL